MYDNQRQTAAGLRGRDLINEALKALGRMHVVRETAVRMDRARKVQARKDAVRMLVAAKTAGPTVAAPRVRDLINEALKARGRMLAVRETAVRMVQARKVLTRKDAVRTLAAAKIAGPMDVARKAPDRKIEVRISNDASPIWKDEWANLLAA